MHFFIVSDFNFFCQKFYDSLVSFLILVKPISHDFSAERRDSLRHKLGTNSSIHQEQTPGVTVTNEINCISINPNVPMAVMQNV